MTDLLVKLFVPDYEQVRKPAVRERYGVLAGTVGILLNILLSLGKLAAGLMTSSVSVLGDALNNLTDAGSSVATLVGFRVASMKADDKHPYGHGRMEYLSGFLVALVIMVVGVELAKTSVLKILHPEGVAFSSYTVIVLLISIGAKLWLSRFNCRLGKRINSTVMRAASMDSLTDSVATAAVLAGVMIHKFTGWNVDGWVGLIVAAFILRAGWGAVKDTLDPLLGASPDPELIRAIRKTVLGHPQIIGMHDLIIHDYGPGRTLMTFHAEVPLRSDIVEAHEAIDHIERELHETYGIETSIHMDPVDTEDVETCRVRRQVAELVKTIDPDMSIHDFRMTRGPLYSNLIFDVVVPHTCSLTDTQVQERVDRAVRVLNPAYRIVLQIDRTYLILD